MEEVTLHEEELDLVKEEEAGNMMSEVAELKLTDDGDPGGTGTCASTIGSEGDSEAGENEELGDIEQSNDSCKEAAEEDLMTKMIAKLKVLELQNIEYVNETDNQKKVIEMLRLEVSKKDEENQAMQKDLKTTKETFESKYAKLQEETTKEISKLKKAYEHANRDKESMVIKYAMGEKDILIAKRGKEDLEKKLKEALKDNDSYQYKVRTLGTERTRLQGLCEARGAETVQAKKELDKVREDMKLCEAKLTLANDKFKLESDAHKITKENLDRTFKELLELQGSVDDVKAEYTDLIAKAKQEEDSKRQKEIIQVKEQSVKLMIDSAAAAELETLKSKYKEAIDENNDLSVKVQSNEKDLLKYESSLSELKETLAKQKSEIVDLYSQCAELESVKVQLTSEAEKVAARDAEVARLRAESTELLSDMAACRRKEGELLDFTQKLTDKNVGLQSEFSSIQARASVLEEEHSKLVEAKVEAESELADTRVKLDTEVAKRKEETELLARKLAEKVKALETATMKVIDANNDVEVVRRQNQARVRELSKELNSLKKRLEVAEAGSRGQREGSPGQLSVSLSRCSSSSSLSRDSELSPNGLNNSGPGDNGGLQTRVSLNSLHENGNQDQSSQPVSLPLPPADTQQLLVEKIVKLQKACARRQEKLDILEEHISQLMNEIKKKNRIIQSYVMNLEPGALISEESDIHKAKVGASQGIMASLYNSKVTDSGMTLELSLEINKKLQAVLEDTLLKNITLKDNISTLGAEISKISINNQRGSNS